MLLALLGVEIAFGRLIPGVGRDDRGKSIKPPPQTPIEILQGIPIEILQGIRNLNKGCWHSVSRTQFDTYGSESGIGYWTLGGRCRTLAFVPSHAGRLRQKFG